MIAVSIRVAAFGASAHDVAIGEELADTFIEVLIAGDFIELAIFEQLPGGNGRGKDSRAC